MFLVIVPEDFVDQHAMTALRECLTNISCGTWNREGIDGTKITLTSQVSMTLHKMGIGTVFVISQIVVSNQFRTELSSNA